MVASSGVHKFHHLLNATLQCVVMSHCNVKFMNHESSMDFLRKNISF